MLKRIELEDFTKYKMLNCPQISPTAEKVCFMLTMHRMEENDYETNLWMADCTSGNVTQFTSGGKDLFPRWSPDGKRIVFISKRTLKKDETGSELWAINANGGEAQLLLKQEGSISNVRWSPDGKKLLFLSTVTLQQEEEGVRVIRGIPIYVDGSNFVYNWRRHLFVLDLATNQADQITKGDIDVYYAEFSHNSDQIAYVAENALRRMLGTAMTVLFIVSLHDGIVQQLTTSDMRIGALTWDSEDRHIAFQGSNLKRGRPTHDHIFVLSVENQSMMNLTKELDLTVIPMVSCDVTGPFNPVQGPIWQGAYIYFLLSEHGRARIYRVTYPEGVLEPVVAGDIRVTNFSIAKDVIAFVRTTPTEPTEIWVKEGEILKQLTTSNKWLESYHKVTPEHFRFNASDGIAIDGWVMRPPEFEESKRYPTILIIHGGPKGTYGFGFMHDFQYLAAQNYVVIYTNPRGSGGYSEEFANVRGDLGGRDYQDIMEAMDYGLETYPFIDPERLGVEGISYGGFMTNWIIGHTDRFKAAVTQASISNQLSFFGTSDIGFWFVADYAGGEFTADPWKVEAKYLEQSPLRYAPNVKTATLVMNWDEDHRCPFEQGLQFYTALQYFGVESELVLLQGSPHSISLMGKPKTKRARLQHLTRWFTKYL